jgi:hypothetical protein
MTGGAAEQAIKLMRDTRPQSLPKPFTDTQLRDALELVLPNGEMSEH